MHIRSLPYPGTILALAVASGGFVAALFAMGRIPVCECGIGLFTPEAAGSATSQHLLDPYSLSHVLHGVLFYPLFFYAARRLPLRTRFLLAVLLEMGWEILENTPFVIDRYRTATAARGYTGDSILNSAGDVLSMILGYAFARRAPVWASVLLFAAIELLMLLLFRDNLTLNVLMLLYPLDAVRDWQLGV